VDRLENFDPSTWPRCKNPRCRHGRIFWDGYPELSLKLRPAAAPDTGETGVVPFVHYVGKCDRCGLFHVWCRTCDDILAIRHDNEQEAVNQCRCAPPWFWLASVEEDDELSQSAELHVFMMTGEMFTVERRPL